MFTNKNGCTVYEKTIFDRNVIYIRHAVSKVYWQPSISESTGKERSEQDSIFVSIPEKSADYLPKVGDKIVSEVISDEQPPLTAYTITAVKDLRYGSPKVRHIEVTAK
jgi:hypothetical protein